MGKMKMVLASSSPRRRALLQEAGYRFEVAPPVLGEPPLPEMAAGAAAAWAEALAYFKARAVVDAWPDAVVIGADTVVEHDGRLLGKPRDEQHAREILTHHFAGRNEVITGLAVLLPQASGRIITHDVTTLVMRPMRAHELEAYLAGGAWQGKAGAYALQEGGDRFVQAMSGSAANVVGLPVELLADILERWHLDVDRLT